MLSFPPMEAPPSSHPDRPLALIAHRGESEEFPENTSLAFEEAIKAGAGLVECDVHLTKDQRIVVVHDPSLDRTTDRSGLVADLTFRQIREASAGYPARFGSRFRDQKIQTLDEVLDLTHQRARLFIEIKPESIGIQKPSPLVVSLLECLKDRRLLREVFVISFHPDALSQCRHLNSELKTGILFHAWPEENPQQAAEKAGADFMIFNKDLLAEEKLKQLKECPLPFGAYTVDEARQAQALSQSGVYGIATNRFRKMLKDLRSAGWEQHLDLRGEGFMRIEER